VSTPQGKKRIAILISGRGSNMMALVEAAHAPDFNGEIALIAANRPDAAGLDWAAARGLETLALDHTSFPDRAAFEAALDTALRAHKIDIIALAGFMRVLGADFVSAWAGRILNIHPSLLPAFRGLHAHEQALAAGVRFSGCTVHIVTPDLDDGPILGQAVVPVQFGDTAETLAARVIRAEHRLYPAILKAFVSGDSRREAAYRDTQFVLAEGDGTG